MSSHTGNPNGPAAQAAPGLRIGGDWLVARHAELRAIQRGFTVDHVLGALTDPDVVYPDCRGGGRVRYVRGHVLVVAIPDEHLVVTVLVHTDADWGDDAVGLVA